MGKAAVWFKDGEIVQANFLKLRDKDAVFALLGVKNGHFSYTRGVPDELENLPSIGDFLGILMEGLQRIDEDQEE
jgi:CRP/FNR family cyclic AMP-dependent transcriptional regulator